MKQYNESQRWQPTLRISLAALEDLSKTLWGDLASKYKISALIQRRMKGFHDCSERSATKIFLDSWRDAAISTIAFSYPAWGSCNPWTVCNIRVYPQEKDIIYCDYLTLDAPRLPTSLGVKERHNRAAPGNSLALLLSSANAMLIRSEQKRGRGGEGAICC